ncbi:MAG TPA: hypothetical protein VGN19_09965 [Pedococcus sp.]|jgi:uncharacterized protein YukE|nr:hypothetical protein [Pedococcus sp.]
MTGDLHTLTVLAARLRAEAERTRELTSRVGHAREVSWQSVAARAFRANVDHVVTGLRRVSDELDEAAAALDRHVQAVQAARDAIALAGAHANAVGEGLVRVAGAVPANGAALAVRAAAELAR